MATAASSRYLAYLPAIFQQRTAAGQEPYLGQFLRPFENAFQTFDAALFDLERYFTPALTTADDFLPWLATWIALLVDEEWDEDQRRQLLSEAVELYRWRGTTRGLRRYLEIYTGLKPENIALREARWPSGMQIGVASRIGGLQAPSQCLATIMAAVNTKPLAHRDYYVVNAIRTAEPTSDGASTQTEVTEAYQVYSPTEPVEQVMLNDGTVKMVFAGGASAAYHPATVQRRNELADNCYQLTLDEKASTTIPYRGDPLVPEETNAPYRFVVEIQGASAQPVRQLLTQWLGELRNGSSIASQATVVNAQFAKALREPLTAKARANLIGLQNQIAEFKVNQLSKQQVDQFCEQLTAILSEPLTEIERFVTNWQAPSAATNEEQLRIQATLRRKQEQGQRKLRTILALEKPAHTTYYLKATPVVSKVKLHFMGIGLYSSIGLNTTVG